MLNFTGQTRRRNVNLGNRTRNSKKDLLEKAKRERERRAQDKLKEDASKTIQKSIRRHFSNVRLFKNTFTSSQLVHMIPAYGGKLIYYISQYDLQQLLKLSHNFLSSYPNSLGNRQLLSLLKLYQDDALVAETLSDLNMDCPTVDEFLDSLSVYLCRASF
ncbi:AAC_collapsed_G0019070.mRNA.1.CDS.1 [Saccharomyces cerevisiae]|nr:AAC_collapsed_G0019070.mRNA.1.CDS.1 [Saccharomyces cerevisiae]